MHTHTVHISDCDAYQMVYHTNYLRWCERARHAYFGRAALVGLLRERQLRVCLREARHARYFDSARLGDVLDIETRVAECDRSHVVFDHQVKRRDGGKLLFRLVADTVVVDAASGAAAQFPHSLLATGAALVPEGAAARKVSAFPGGSELTDPVPPQWHTWDEECEVDLTEAVSGAMSQDKIVDLWERARTTASMGPAGLRAMQLDPSLGGGNIFVVGRMDRVRFHATVLAVFGDKLQVRSCIEMRSVGGQRDVCAHWHQRLWRLGAGGAADALVAEGIVTMFSINAQQQPVPAGSLKAGLMPYMLPSVAGSG